WNRSFPVGIQSYVIAVSARKQMPVKPRGNGSVFPHAGRRMIKMLLSAGMKGGRDMDASRMRKAAVRWALIAAGAALYAFALEYFIVSNRLMEGGVTGIAVLLHYAAGTPVSLSALLLNLPLFWLGWRRLGQRAMLYTIGGTVLLSLFLWIWETVLSA